jgi:hypothetical protein
VFIQRHGTRRPKLPQSEKLLLLDMGVVGKTPLTFLYHIMDRFPDLQDVSIAMLTDDAPNFPSTCLGTDVMRASGATLRHLNICRYPDADKEISPHVLSSSAILLPDHTKLEVLHLNFPKSNITFFNLAVQNGPTLTELYLFLDHMGREEERLLTSLYLPVLTDISLSWMHDSVGPLPAMAHILLLECSRSSYWEGPSNFLMKCLTPCIPLYTYARAASGAGMEMGQ